MIVDARNDSICTIFCKSPYARIYCCRWGNIEFPMPFGRVMKPTEGFIHGLDEKVLLIDASGFETLRKTFNGRSNLYATYKSILSVSYSCVFPSKLEIALVKYFIFC